MPVGLYMDVHVPKAITIGLRLRGVDVITAQDDGTTTLPDDQLLDRATELNRPLVSSDVDLLVEAQKRQQENIPFAGVIYVHTLRLSIGERVDNLELVAKLAEPGELANRVTYLPL